MQIILFEPCGQNSLLMYVHIVQYEDYLSTSFLMRSKYISQGFVEVSIDLIVSIFFYFYEL